MGKLDGQCLCGAVTYKSDADPVFMGMCHCTDCQRQTGSAFASVVVIPADQFELEGELSTYTTTGDAGTSNNRRFCPQCGSSVLTEHSAFPGMVLLRAGGIEDWSWFEPQAEVFGKSAQPWVQEHATRFETSPPSG